MNSFWKESIYFYDSLYTQEVREAGNGVSLLDKSDEMPPRLPITHCSKINPIKIRILGCGELFHIS